MKLYYIASARMPNKKAYAIQIAKMCEAFAGEEVELELIVPKQKNAIEDIKDYYQLHSTFRVTRLPTFCSYASSRWGYFISSISFVILYSMYLIVKILRGERGVVYTIDTDTFSFAACAFLGMPCFLETHGGKAKSWINTIFFKRVKGVIVINNIIKKQIAKTLAFPENKILVWPNGIDLDLFRDVSKDEARNSLSLPKDIKIVMYCGRFYGWKGFEVLIEAAKELPPDIFIYVVGGTKEEFLSVTKKIIISKNFIFPGEKPYTEIPLWLSAADAFLVLGTKYDTQSYYYTSPMKVFEYLAMKRPIIASKTPAIQDIVSDKQAVFYESDNYKDLAQKISFTVNDSESIRMKIAAAAIRAKDFTWQKRAKDTVEFIEKNI